MRIHSAKPRRWGGMAVASVLALVVAISGLILVQGDVRAAGTFNPEVDAQVSDDEHLANANITTIFNVPGTDYNYKVLVSFTPPEFGPAAADVPIGAWVGTIDSRATLGLLNGACNTPLAPHFDLSWASTDTSDTCTFDEQFEDSSVPGLKKGTVLYPDVLTRMLPGITPLERLWGMANVSGQLVSINVVVLAPGSLGYPAAWGRPSLSILNDIGDPGAAPSPGEAITDFCTPLETTTVVFGVSKDNPATTGANEAGHEMRSNPAYGGTYTFRWYTESMPDADGDGYENYGDTCPFDVNVDPSFKLTAGHPDSDGIDSACEPEGGATVTCWPGAPGGLMDCDNDGFYNRGDNCPLVANPDQADRDGDDIGDACDIVGAGGIGLGPDTPDGVPIKLTLEADVEISGPAAGEETPTPTPTPTATPTASPTVVAAETTLAEDAKAGDTEIAVEDATGFEVGDTIKIGTGDTAEECTITAIADTTLTLDCTLEFDHAAGEPVVKVMAVVLTPTPTVVGVEDICAPVFPGTYNGFVRIEGQPAASGYEVTASIDGVQWGSDIVSGGHYAMDIPDYMPSIPPCFEGGSITFAVNGMTCTPTADWAPGIQTVDLDCAPAAPPVTPPATPPATPPVTPPVTPAVTPVAPPPSGAGGLFGSGPGLPLWALALASWAGLTIVAGLGTLLAAKRG